ncbi:MAG: hypothetical protein WAW36_04255 [Methylovulum miyakonense]|uniref:hypothetical protein n=1 Tax=Methylovulum miyakonense TaxID=645578 RepID=UPI003BB7B565
MPHFNELSTLLNQHFRWNKVRMDGLIGMVVALFFKETINLTKLAQTFLGKVKADSHYRRMQRLISNPGAVGFDRAAWFAMKLFGFLDTDYYLTFETAPTGNALADTVLKINPRQHN